MTMPQSGDSQVGKAAYRESVGHGAGTGPARIRRSDCGFHLPAPHRVWHHAPVPVRRLGALLACLFVAAATLAPFARAPLAGAAPATPTAATAPCTIKGTPHRDVLHGTPGWDVICGFGGDDVIYGGGGDDILRGGDGRDVLYGEGGDDALLGGDGADTLVGGSGADRLDGGPGANGVDGGPGADTCTWHAGDVTLTRCAYDHAKPVIHWATVSASQVNVTKADATVTIRVRLSDDTAVFSSTNWAPYAFLSDPRVSGSEVPPANDLTEQQITLHKASGTDHDGIWEAQALVPRGFPAVRLDLELVVSDTVLHETDHTWTDAVAVSDDAPDTTPPSVQVLDPVSGATLDARTEHTVAARMRIRDADTGVVPATAHSENPQVYVCLQRPDWTRGSDRCASAAKTSGTLHDGIWRATLPLYPGMTSGDACLWVAVADRARPAAAHSYGCADAVLADAPTSMLAFTGASARLTLRGTTPDAAPKLTGFGASDRVGDVTVSAAASDDHTVTAVRVALLDPSAADPLSMLFWSPLKRTATGGWTGQVAPGRRPAGTYYYVVEVEDRSHVRTYAGPEAAAVLDAATIGLAGDPSYVVE